MIARILVVFALVLLVAAPAPELAGSVQVEIVEEAAPFIDDEVVEPLVAAHAGARARVPSGRGSERLASPGPALARVFRPPRPARAHALEPSSGHAS